MLKKRGQVWIETALYTLIGLTLIGLVLGFVNPRINQSRDTVLVEQTISSLNILDERINIIEGNIRVFDFAIRKGEFYILPEEDKIVFSLNDLSKPYSENGSTIDLGRIELFSLKVQKGGITNLTLSYAGRFDIQFNGGEDNVKFNSAPTPYKFSVTNKGKGEGLLDVINIEEVS
jgi:hypothetical protein